MKRKEDILLVKNEVIQQTNQQNVFFSFELKQNLSAISEHGLYIEQKKLLLIHFASISTLLKKQ